MPMDAKITTLSAYEAVVQATGASLRSPWPLCDECKSFLHSMVRQTGGDDEYLQHTVTIESMERSARDGCGLCSLLLTEDSRFQGPTDDHESSMTLTAYKSTLEPCTSFIVLSPQFIKLAKYHLKPKEFQGIQRLIGSCELLLIVLHDSS